MVSETIQASTPGVGASATDVDDTEGMVQQIIAAYEPVVLAQRRVLAKVWRDRSISKLNMHLLMLLEAHGPQSMSELAAHTECSLPNLTGTVTRMEELGMVKRIHGQDDRRKVIVRATSKGRALVKQIESVRHEELRRILLRLTTDERALCLTAMQTLARAVNDPEPQVG